MSPSVAEPSSTVASLSSPSTASSFSPSPPPVSLLGLYPHLFNQFLSYQFSYPGLSPFVPVINPAALPYLQRKPSPSTTAQEAAATQSVQNSPHSQSENDSIDDAVSSTDTNSITSSSVLLMAKSPEKLNDESSLELPITSVALNSVIADPSKNSTLTTQPSFQYSPGRLSSSFFPHAANYGMPSFFPLFSPPAKPTVLLSPTHFSYLPFTPAFQPLSTSAIIHSSTASSSSLHSSVASSTTQSSHVSSHTNSRKRTTGEPSQSPKRHSSDNDSDTEKCRKQQSATSNNNLAATAGNHPEEDQGKSYFVYVIETMVLF